MAKKTIGIIAGFNQKAAVAIKALLLANAGDDELNIVLSDEQFRIDPDPLYKMSDRKIFVFNETEKLDQMGCDLVLVPDFASAPFIDEVQTEVQVKVLDIKTALMSLMGPEAPVMGILDKALAGDCATGTCDISQRMKMVFLSDENQARLDANRERMRTVGVCEETLIVLKEMCEALMADGAQAIMPNCSHYANAQKELAQAGFPVIDAYEAYAKVALQTCTKRLPKPFKLGLIGGLGPAATVDLYDKIVKATPAANDQEHFKVVIEQNPQIPDRTACLLDGGNDPTLAMYNCAKRLEKDGCDAILIPCNTAHAFLPRLLRGLKTPFIDMQQTMLDQIQAKYGDKARVGLMATSGTVRTGIYGLKAEKMGMKMFTPDAEFQERVMAAIYGPKGAKAGFTTGECYDDLYAAAEHLVTKYDCNVLILGCTELPLIFHECEDFACGGKTVEIVDPTATLARKAVEVAMATNKERGTR